MTVRTFRQLGQGYGAVPCNITAKIDGITVFSGDVSTIDEPVPAVFEQPTPASPVLYTWEKTVDFSGIQLLEISVSGSPLVLATTQATHSKQNDDSTQFGAFFFFRVIPDDFDSIHMWDPLSDIQFDGIDISRPLDQTLVGQWYWTIPVGSVFTASINTQLGKEPA